MICKKIYIIIIIMILLCLLVSSRMMAASEVIRKRAFMVEFNEWESWDNVADDIAKAESIGFRTFAPTKDNALMATVQNHMKLYGQGIDVAYTYNLQNAVTARQTVNTQNGISPP